MASPEPTKFAGMANAPAYHWKAENGKHATPAEKERAIIHICKQLETGLCTLRQILWYMVPRLPNDTLKHWRMDDPEIAERIDAAFEVGADNMDERRYLVATGADGHKYPVERAKLVCNVLEKQLAVRSARHRPKTVISNDPEAPFLPAQFVVTPVQPGPQDDEEVSPEDTDED